MKEFEELQQIWRKNMPASNVGFDAVMRKIRAGERELTTKMWRHVIAFALGLVILGYVWVTVTFVTWTSHLALLLVAGCMLYALLAQWKAYREIRQNSLESTDRPEEFMAYLKRFKADRYRQHTRSL